MIKFTPEIQKELITLSETKNLFLEGNIVKVINSDGDANFEEYLKKCGERDVANRKKRLDITKQIQTQNKDLSDLNAENQRIMTELQTTLEDVEYSKNQIELQNRELIAWKEDNERISLELRDEMVKSEQSRMEAEKAKQNAENDLDVLQKKTQFELINTIVRVALIVIVGVGLVTTALYTVALFTGQDTQIIGSTWSNMFGILLTNAFSIVGTIMGVKYASEKPKKN
jgi:predicted RNase H-like nuclease (RuvC/YqgF family)